MAITRQVPSQPRLGSDERKTRILLDTLIALRLLERDEAHRLTTLADAFLATGRPGYLGGTINIMAAPWIWTAFQNLPKAVRHGGTVLDQPAETPEWQFWETFASSSSAIAIPAAQMLVELLQARTQQRGSLSIPDIACGSGLYSLNSRLNTQRRMPRCSIGPT